MREYIKQYSAAVYRRTTRDTFAGTWGMVIAIVLGIIALSSFMFGVLSGASIALEGGSVSSQVAAIQSVETQVWSGMLADYGGAGRAVYGLFHWIAVLAGWLAIGGVQLGYSLPVAGYAVKYIGTPVMWGMVLLFGLQIIRAVELAYYDIREERGTHG